jgi:GntR family transcriptional regulator
MIFEVSPTDDRPLYLQIVDEVRRAIVLGVLKPEEPLPSVRELAADLRINPNTVQQAYRELEREGAVYVRRGQGTFVSRNSGGADERAALRDVVARRAARDAYRHGLSIRELIEALHSVEGENQ